MRLRTIIAALGLGSAALAAAPAGAEGTVGTTFPEGFAVPTDESLRVPVIGFGAAGEVTRVPVIFLHGNNDTPYPTSCNGAYGAIQAMAQFFADHGYALSELWGLGYQGDQCDLLTDQNRRSQFAHSTAANVPDLDAFVKAVLAFTGATQIDIVGHSLGVTLAREWMRQTNAYGIVRRLVGLDGPNHGIINCSPSPQNYWQQVGGFTPSSAICQEYGSDQTPLLKVLNAGDETPGPTEYLMIRNADTSFVYFDRQDGTLAPVPAQDMDGNPHDFSQSAMLAPDVNVTNVTVTGQGAFDPALGTAHLGIVNSPAVWQMAFDFLSAPEKSSSGPGASRSGGGALGWRAVLALLAAAAIRRSRYHHVRCAPRTDPPKGGRDMRRTLLLLGAVLLSLGLATPQAAATGSVTLEASFTTGIQDGWVRVERYRDLSSGFTAETYPSDGRGDQTGQTKTFFGGVARPHSSRFLLYHAPGWSTGTKPTPVLLVHGANQTADIAWANPNELGGNACGASTCPSTGLMQYLDARGYKVFAITFPHKNGNGYFWAEQIYDAIQIIKSKTGASQVDVIGWSKSSFNARMYASSVKQTWGTAYAGNVRRMILLGSPNNGVDGSFRHGWTYTFTVYSECGGSINGPVAHDWIVCFGVWWNHPEWTYGSSFFPGSKQMLKRWDSVFGLATTEQDWWTTYYGGWGFYTHSDGIQAFLVDSLVDTVRGAGVPSSIRTHNLCGSANDIPLLHNEHTGPSDGVVFIASCDDNTGIANPGGNVTLAINHLKLGWQSSAMAQIEGWLAAP